MTDSSTLWHYTDAGGLLGILASNPEPREPNVVGPRTHRPEFRATAAEYLNDSRELIHGLSVIRDDVLLPRANELAGQTTHAGQTGYVPNAPAKAAFLRNVCAEIDRIERREYPSYIHCYVTSFSTNPDSLSQWRGYCGGLGGFAIGIDRSKLPERGEWMVRKVDYNDPLGVLAAQVDNWTAWRLQPTEAPSSSEGMLNECIRALAVFAMQVKHAGFEEEAEWRVIHTAVSEGARYRTRGAQLIPFSTWSVPADAVVGVRVGPGPRQHENYLAAKGMLYAHCYPKAAANLEKSDTPYR
ncbi:DUF2971 domain-containing protein [Nocardia sp. NPDC003693]